MLENLKQQFNEALPAWLQYTATGKKLLQERDEALSKARSVAEATAAAEREELVRQYQEAVLAEKSDEELQAMIQKRDEFMAASTHLKTRQIHAEATLPLKRMTDAIAQRIRPHRERVDRLRKELRASAPAWQQAVIASFIEDLETIRQSIGSLTTLDEKKVFGLNDGGRERVVEVLDYQEYRVAMCGPGSRFGQGWLSQSSSSARKLLMEVLTPEDCKQRLAAIRKSQPVQKPTWRSA